MKDAFRLALTLTLIASLAGMVLAWVHEVTLEPIARAEANRRDAAVRAVMPPGDQTPTVITLTDPENNDEHTFYVTFDAHGHWKAVALEGLSEQGYGGTISIMVGIARDAEGAEKLIGYTVLAHQETPGLGAHIAGETARERLANRPLASTNWRVRQDGGEIEAITAATISSRAVLEAVRNAIDRLDRLRDHIVPPSATQTETAP